MNPMLVFWVRFFGVVAALLLLAVGLLFLMEWLERRKRDVAEEKKPTPLYHLPRCGCLLHFDGTIAAPSRECQNLTKLAIAAERKRLEHLRTHS